MSVPIWAGRVTLLCSALLLVADGVAAAPGPCANCVRKLTVDRDRWECLSAQLDTFAGRAAEPVRIATIGCKTVRRGTIPDTSVTGGRSGPARRPEAPSVVQLTRGQMTCLKSNKLAIDARFAKTPDVQTIDVVALCGEPSVGGGPAR